MLASSWSCKQLLLSGTLEGEGKHEITTPNIALFGFCWILKIRRLPVLGLEFEAESQKWMEARACDLWRSRYNTYKHDFEAS